MIFSLGYDFIRKYLSNRSEDAKNGFYRNFYIDPVVQKKSQLFFRRRKKYFMKIFLKFWKFENYFFHFFFDEKKCNFFWITISMWNFLENPFFASSERFDKYFRMKSTLKGKNHDFELNPPIFGQSCSIRVLFWVFFKTDHRIV